MDNPARSSLIRNAQIERDFKSGKTLRELESVYSLSYERIRQILKRRGIGKKDGGGFKKKEALRNIIRQNLDYGRTDDWISKNHNIPLTYVTNVKKLLRRETNKKRKSERVALVKTLCEDGMSQVQISRRLNTTIENVRRIAVKEGFKFKQGKRGPVNIGTL